MQYLSLRLCLLQVFAENPDLDASKMWNCNESGFPTDLSKGKVVAPKVSGYNHLFMLDYFSSVLVLQERCDGKLTSAFFMQVKIGKGTK